VENSVLGIHHITAITDDPQRNINYYVGILGLRFVKKTVNFDAPDTYHLYYGDDLGHPGTILTFFSWPGYSKGRSGVGQATTVSFAVPESSLSYWQERLRRHNIHFEGPISRFDEHVLSFSDPDGLGLELVARPGSKQGSIWTQGPVPVEYAIHGFHGVTLSVAKLEGTEVMLTQVLGFQQLAQADKRIRYTLGTNGIATIVDVQPLPGEQRGIESIGTVHHVAWRTADDNHQLEWRSRLLDLGIHVTPVQDRMYFHSIYFREPSGILFEIATDQPGFSVDEAVEELGTHLKLPSWLESLRPTIERSLPLVHLPPTEMNKEG
jgi:glyoxalase family protein